MSEIELQNGIRNSSYNNNGKIEGFISKESLESYENGNGVCMQFYDFDNMVKVEVPIEHVRSVVNVDLLMYLIRK